MVKLILDKIKYFFQRNIFHHGGYASLTEKKGFVKILVSWIDKHEENAIFSNFLNFDIGIYDLLKFTFS